VRVPVGPDELHVPPSALQGKEQQEQPLIVLCVLKNPVDLILSCTERSVPRYRNFSSLWTALSSLL
jgi:hypothetical protein